MPHDDKNATLIERLELLSKRLNGDEAATVLDAGIVLLRLQEELNTVRQSSKEQVTNLHAALGAALSAEVPKNSTAPECVAAGCQYGSFAPSSVRATLPEAARKAIVHDMRPSDEAVQIAEGKGKLKLGESYSKLCDEILRLAKEAPASATRPTVLEQVEAALRKNPLIAKFLDIGFWGAHHADIVIRHNGKDERYEADWLKDLWYIIRRRGLTATEAVRAEQSGKTEQGAK
jgi:hypothetical protein